MDARIDPAKALGLNEGDAHVIRNAGGRASEALRSIVISQQLLGTREVVVVHHASTAIYFHVVEFFLGVFFCLFLVVENQH